MFRVQLVAETITVCVSRTKQTQLTLAGIIALRLEELTAGGGELAIKVRFEKISTVCLVFNLVAIIGLMTTALVIIV